MQNPVERALEAVPFCFGEILVRKSGNSLLLCHRDEDAQDDLEMFQNPEDAIEIAKYDDAGNYRPLKTAPNLRHGWRMKLQSSAELKHALGHFYPGRLAVFFAWQRGELPTTSLRETLDRQSGMYRIAATISDAQIDDLVAGFCHSNGGCLRTILWKRDQHGTIASVKLPREKFDPGCDQFASVCSRRPPGDARASQSEAATVPLLCQESCNLLVAACRKVVKGE